MIKSMTGYGRGQSQQGNLSFTVEIKSVNHRHVDVNVKAPRLVNSLEGQIKKQASAVLKRGKIDIFINQNNNIETTVRPVVNQQLAAAYLEALRPLQALGGVTGDFSPEFIASLPDVVKMEDVRVPEEDINACLQEALTQALESIVNMRVAEGAATSLDMKERIDLLSDTLVQIEAHAKRLPEEWQRKLTERLARLMETDYDPQRVAQEIAIFADRSDISEEVVRFRSHLQQFGELLISEDPVGRQMDFLVQELNREANTMGSKSNDAVLTRSVVNLKSELEKIREQVQNIE